MKYLLVLIPMFSGVIYHLGQKKIREDISPFIIFTIIYMISMLVMFLMGLLGNEKILPTIKSLSHYDWGYLILVAFGVIGIELGFLLVYRSGLPITTSALVTNTGLGLILLAVGVVMFKEFITYKQGIGVAFSLLGIYLLKG